MDSMNHFLKLEILRYYEKLKLIQTIKALNSDHPHSQSYGYDLSFVFVKMLFDLCTWCCFNPNTA